MGTKVYDNALDLITFTRASGGTALRKISYGPELVTNGGFDADSNWTKGTGWTISGDVANANVTSFSQIFQAVGAEIGKLYSVTFTVVWVSGALGVGLGNNGQNASTPIASSGTYTRLIFVAAGTSSGNVYFRGNASGTGAFVGTIDNISVKEVLFDRPDGTLTLFNHPTNIPRIEYAADGTLKGLLIEEQRTNLLTYSNDLSSWVNTGSSDAQNVAGIFSPDGLEAANSITEDVATSAHAISLTTASNVTSGVTYTFSVFCKKKDRRYIQLVLGNSGFNVGLFAVFDFDTGTWTSATGVTTFVEDVGGGWFRLAISGSAVSTAVGGVVISHVTTSTAARLESYAGDGVSQTYIWGAQLEAGAFPTSYIPTSGATATRSADIASIPVTDFGYNPDAGTLVVEADTFSGLNFSASVRPYTLTGVNSQIGATFIFDNAAFDLSDSSAPSGKHATAFKSGSMAIVNNAGSPRTASSALDGDYSAGSIIIGGFTSATNLLNGHIKSIQYYPRRLSNAQLQELTS